MMWIPSSTTFVEQRLDSKKPDGGVRAMHGLTLSARGKGTGSNSTEKRLLT
jgi:hypothetical protein